MKRPGAYRAEIEPAGATDGPFASFTDLLAGIVFVLLIMVAILMLRQQKAVEEIRERSDPTKYEATIDDMKKIAVNLIKENADLSGKLAETDGKLKAMQSEFTKNPRLHQAMVFHQYGGLVFPQRESMSFDKTITVYLTEDRSRYMLREVARGPGSVMFPEKPASAAEFVSPPQPLEVRNSCAIFDRNQWSWNCPGDTSQQKLLRNGNTYVGQHSESQNGKFATWDVRLEILAIYDDYFR